MRLIKHTLNNINLVPDPVGTHLFIVILKDNICSEKINRDGFLDYYRHDVTWYAQSTEQVELTTWRVLP